VKVHLGAAFRNMGVNNRARAVAAFRQRDEERERKMFFEGAAASPATPLAKLRPGQGLKTRAQ
jgi:hypothetical protein